MKSSLPHFTRWIVGLCLGVAIQGVAWAGSSDQPARLMVQPSRIALHGPAAAHGLLVTAITSDGRMIDVTGQADFFSSDPQCVTVSSDGLCTPASDGQAEVTAAYGGLTATVPVTVSDVERPSVPSFRHEVIPLLTRFGCNQGACHGKQAGQNGFRLSLRGYAPDWDHEWMTREFQGRRISYAVPADSLLLRKPLGQMPHGGGRLFRKGSRAHRTLREWIESKTPGLLSGEPVVERLEVLPGDRTLRPGDSQRLLVRAHLTDGSIRDVTWLSQFFSNDPSVLETTPDGHVTSQRPGESAIRVHFQEQVEVITFTVPHPETIDSDLFAARNNLIDAHVYDKLAALRIPPSPVCDDATFLRRAFLDTIGTLPTPDEVREFLADERPDKRSRLIDQLLERPEFVDYWTLKLADLLQNRKERDHDVRGTKGVRAFHAWLRRQVAANRPWDELARDILTALGDSVRQPQIGYYIVTVGEHRRAEESEVVDSVAQAFLGTRIGCARCHNHPLEKYTQDDYYHLTAFFSRTSLDRQNPQQGPTELFVASPEARHHLNRIEQLEKAIQDTESALNAAQGDEAKSLKDKLAQQGQQLEEVQQQLEQVRQKPVEVRQPRTNEMLPPQPLDRTTVTIRPGQDPRTALVEWMTDPGNPYFSGSMVNRIWKHFLGVGLVEPVDDLRASNPPSNAALWQALNHEFVSHGYDLKHLMRLILNSRTYQLSAETRPGNERDRRFYSHYYARRLPAEVLLDAISLSTGVPDQFPGYPVGMRAIQMPDPGVNSYFLSLFGRSDRVTACACERKGDVTLPQLLHLQNSDALQQKLNSPNGRLKAWLEQYSEDDPLIEEIFLATLSREPTDEEWAAVRQALSSADDRGAAFRDLFWALLNTKEFAFNH